MDATLDLSGYSPLYEYSFDFSSFSSTQLLKRSIHLDYLNNKIGCFIIELFGNNRKTRCLLRKGDFNYIYHDTSHGIAIKLIKDKDNNNNNSKEYKVDEIKRGKIMLNGQVYESDDKTGIILIPYNASETITTNIIAIATIYNDELKQEEEIIKKFTNFNYRKENYNLYTSFYIDRENLLNNTKVDIVMSNLLLLNNKEKIDINHMENVKLMIHTSNDEDITNTQTIHDFKLYNDKESIYNFICSNNIHHIHVELCGDVLVKSTLQRQQLHSEYTFTLNSIDKSNRLEDIYLKRGNDGYYLELLGKSGEIIDNKQLNITLQHYFLQHDLTQIVKTDKYGRVYLGPYDFYDNYIRQINVTAQYDSEKNKATKSFTFYPSKINMNKKVIHSELSKDGKIIIPLPIPNDNITKITPFNFQFFQCANEDDSITSDDAFLHDLTSSSNISLTYNNEQQCVVLSKLKAGRYILKFKNVPKNNNMYNNSIEVIIAEGNKLMKEYIVNNKEMIQLNDYNQIPLHITSVKQEKSKNKDNKDDDIIIQLAGYNNDTTRIHIISSLLYHEYNIFELFYPTYKQPTFPSITELTRIHNEYLSSKRVGDEEMYVLNRQLLPPTTSSMLPQPSLLLNRKFKQNTQYEDDPELNAGEKYEKEKKEEVTINKNVRTII